MTIPTGARFEARIAGGIVLLDVSHLLPRHKKKRYGVRDEPIERLFIHHSGALGKPGYQGMVNSAKFTTRTKLLRGRGFPGFPYTYWLAHVPDVTPEGDLVIYRGQQDEVESWHTGGTNNNSCSLAWQLNSSKKPASPAQIEMAEGFIPWWMDRHRETLEPTPLSFHADAGNHGGRSKKTCPGLFVQGWVEAYRAHM